MRVGTDPTRRGNPARCTNPEIDPGPGTKVECIEVVPLSDTVIEVVLLHNIITDVVLFYNTVTEAVPLFDTVGRNGWQYLLPIVDQRRVARSSVRR